MGGIVNSAVVYRRVSSARQSDEGKSLADQDAELIDYCKAMRWQIIGNFSDAESGRKEKTAKRKGLSAAIALACEHKATLVVYDLDRLARSQSIGMKIVEQLRECGAGLVIKSLGVDTTTPAGEMIVGVMFAIAQWGSRNIGAAVKRANRNTVKRVGHRTQGMPPFGLRFDPGLGKRVPCEKEQEIIAKVLAATKSGKSFAAAARLLNEQGVPTPRKLRYGDKKSWCGFTVSLIAQRFSPAAPA